ncbi:zona pellucida sperm-binding protein 3-like [Xyrichtys novacula]|uniref:Zona pellucida sperm-binding protein 3-like n=1 Tax=Xyrichtys novacula TaxID=13765 RepID=A0AAV1FXK0_XYRNO|nr:zona pellucida sperm-binding protein 3-like [Xyrichtys novacula]
MWSLQLFLFSFLLAFFRLSDTRFLSVRRSAQRGIKEHKSAEVEAEFGAEPERGNSRVSAQQVDQVLQRRMWPEFEPLSWKFPEDPGELENKRPPIGTEPPLLKMKERVAVRCGESRIQVEVSQDLLGRGRRIKPEELTLGGCSATEIDDSSHVLAFESELHGCGSKLVMTDKAFIYAFMLVYKPRALGRGGIVRSQSAVIGVECHYPR